MEKSEILQHLRKYAESKQEEETPQKPDKLLSALKSVSENDIFLGDEPKYFFAYIKCNSTGVGTSSFQGTETQRTVARDYIVDERLFIDGHMGAGAKGLSLFFLKAGQTITYFAKNDIVKLAKEEGFQQHLQYFSDLNFTLTDHRLNRHTVNVTKGPFKYPIRPINAVISQKGDILTVGYIYEKDGKERIIIEPDKSTKLDEKSKSGCLWWIFGIVFPPLLLVKLFVEYVKHEKERMRG